MQRYTATLVGLLVLLSMSAVGQSLFRLGVNLDAAGAFVNIVNHTNRYSNAAGYDSLGWPTSDFDLVLMDGRPVPEWTGVIDDPEQYRIDYSGRYACGFTGQATVRASGTSVTVENLSYDAVRNSTTFDLIVGGYPGANHGLVFLNFQNTRRSASSSTNSGITELRVHRPGYPLQSSKVFTDEYIALCRSADFACYRFYNVQNIWDGEPSYPTRTRWEQRKTPRDAAQTSMANSSGKRDGWCWEYIVALSNMLKKDVWLNVHQSCDSAYVVALAGFLKQELDPAINIYIENSNEVWSPTQATHGPWNQADAQARGISFDQNYARRTVELSRWFAAVFGESAINGRVRVILAGQHAYPGRSDNHLAYINTTFGPPKRYIYATSSALYFGSTNASSTDTAAINAGMLADINAQITNPQTATYRPNHISKARQWDLPGGCTSYEGGPHLPAGGGTANLASQILSHRTLFMASVLERNYLEGWKDIGGGLAMYFTLVSGYNRYGCWGITDDPAKPDRNFKLQAVRSIIQKSDPSTGMGVVATVPARPQVTVTPHPFESVLRFSADTRGRIRITDLLGREMWQGEVLGGYSIHTHTWPAGMYLLHCEATTIRIVKQ